METVSNEGRRYNCSGAAFDGTGQGLRRGALGLCACGEFATWSAIADAAWRPGPGPEPSPAAAGVAGCCTGGAEGRSATPAASIRARNSSGSIVKLPALMVSTKDAAEYCVHTG